MKRCTIIAFLLLIFACGCSKVSSTYQFPNSIDTISSIELYHNENDYGEGTDESKISLIHTLGEQEINDFMTDIYALETARFHPPLWGWGEYFAKVTYSNGDVEILGTVNIEYIESGSFPTGTGSYFFKNESLIEVFADYVDIS